MAGLRTLKSKWLVSWSIKRGARRSVTGSRLESRFDFLLELLKLVSACTNDTTDADPGDTAPGLWLFEMERPAIKSKRGYEVNEERFVEEVDRVMETISIPTATLCRDWGEMVARRHFAKPQIVPKD